MKKPILTISLAILASALTTVSCTSDLKPDIERIEQQQIEADKRLEEKIEQTESSLLASLKKTSDDLAAAKAELEAAIAEKVSIADYQAALTEYSNRLNQIVSAQKTVDNEQNAALEDIYEKIGQLKTYVDGQIADLKTYVDGEVTKLYNTISEKETALYNYINAEIARLQAQIDILKARVQSIVFVPQYTDMKFGLPFSVVKDNAPAPHYAAAAVDTVKNIVYKVSPDSLAESLAKNAKDIFGFLVKDNLKTRAVAAQPELVILEAKGDNTNGEIQFVLKQKGFEPTAVKGDYDVDLDRYAIALGIVDGDRNLGITSPYTQATLAPSSLITVDLYNVYRKVKACKDANGTIVISPNEAVDDNKGANPENLEIKYTGDVAKAPSYKTGYKPSYKAVSTFQKDTVVLYENTYLAAWVSSKNGIATGPYTYDQLDSLGYNISAYVKHSEFETIETSVPGYETTAAISGANAVVSAPVTEAFSPISLYYDAATKSSKMSTRKHLVGKCVAKTIVYKTGISDDSYLIRTAKVDFIQADDIYFLFSLDTLKWSYAQDAAQDNAAFKGLDPVYDRATLKTLKVEASVDNGATYKRFVDGSDEFWGVELKDFDALTRQPYYAASETTATDYESDKILNPVKKGTTQDEATFINTYAAYDAATKALTFGHAATPEKSNYAFVHRAAFDNGTAANKRTATYVLNTRATDLTNANSVNAGAYILPNTSGSQYIAAKSTFAVTTQDRKRDVIYVTGQSNNTIPQYPATVVPSVTTASLNRFDVLVNGNHSFTNHGEYLLQYGYNGGTSVAEHYEIQSGDIKDAVYDAFIAQGIFTTGDFASSTDALTAEIVNNGNMNPGTAYNSGYNSYFKLVSTANDLTLRSQGGYGADDTADNSAVLLTSERLKNLVRIYPDYTEKPFVEDGRFIEYVFFTYTGQEVHVFWSLGSIAAVSGTYEFRTKVAPATSGNRDFAFKANTAGSYANPKWMYMSNIVGIYPSASSTEIEKYDVDGNNYYFGISVADTHLVPEFKLVHNENYTGTDMFGLNASYYILGGTSNLLKYEGTSANVEVAGQLWMYSGTTSVRFPVTAKIKVNGAKGDSIFILRP